jgi:hypothetical protein
MKKAMGSHAVRTELKCFLAKVENDSIKCVIRAFLITVFEDG